MFHAFYINDVIELAQSRAIPLPCFFSIEKKMNASSMKKNIYFLHAKIQLLMASAHVPSDAAPSRHWEATLAAKDVDSGSNIFRAFSNGSHAHLISNCAATLPVFEGAGGKSNVTYKPAPICTVVADQQKWRWDAAQIQTFSLFTSLFKKKIQIWSFE